MDVLIGEFVARTAAFAVRVFSLTKTLQTAVCSVGVKIRGS
jgi:hypothetical protein